MQNLETIGRWIIVAGIVLAVMGGFVWVLGRLKLFDQLPGTLRIQAGGLTCFVPILASIVLSIILTVVLNLILRGMNR